MGFVDTGSGIEQQAAADKCDRGVKRIGNPGDTT
jgi:hypothetical protein